MSRPTTVLVIEDDAAMRHGLIDNLEIEGYGVFGAGTAREGREIALRRRPDPLLGLRHDKLICQVQVPDI